MTKRAGVLGKFMIAVVAAGLILPAFSGAAQAGHRSHGHWKKHDAGWHDHRWQVRKRFVRHMRRRHWREHRTYRRDTRYAVRQTSYPAPQRHAQNLSGNQLLGGLLGAAIGAATGTQFGKGSGRTVAIIGGGLIGALIGGSLGKSMDQTDQYQVNQALETSPTGNAIVWDNPETGGFYKVTPTKTYQVAENAYCREFTTWGMIGGYEEKMYGTACRQPDGSWKTVK